MELIEYFIVNKDLIEKYEMSPGKVAAQVGHVATIIALDKQHDETFKQWFTNEQKKIVLQAKEKELLKLIDIGAFYIRDNGHTQVPAGSLTVVGFEPRDKTEMQKFVKRLRLY